jgi:hypothetical protein
VRASKLFLLLFPFALAGCRPYFALERYLAPAPAVSSRPAPSVSPSSGSLTTEAARQALANAELLQEVYRVVFYREVADRAYFGSLVDSLNQGASLEGVYNGLIHSDDFRGLETANPGARAEALRFFATELGTIESELPAPHELTAADARPLGVLGEAPSPTADLAFPRAQPSDAAKTSAATLAGRYEALFRNASIFTLKRVLNDEMMSALDHRKADPAQLAQWYGAWAARLATTGVDYGVPLRNQPDKKFHEAFARQMPYDRLQWEVLNRLHRNLNALHFVKSGGQP